MPMLAAPWVEACLHSGRIDLSPVIECIGGPDAFGDSPPETLVRCGFPPVAAARSGSTAPLQTPVKFVRLGEPSYPQALAHVPYAPPVLFYRGDLSVLERPAVAIVGTRRCTAYGRRTARHLARGLGLAGAVVVSGLAIGIDAAAHDAAMETGTTVAVLGHGLEADWRQGARRLAEHIVANGGLVLSEFLPSSPADRHTFLQRNRIIAWLSRATVVVEAGHRSGALNTARHALAEHREVLAVPGPIMEGCSDGCLDLIEQGATVLRGMETLLQAAGLALPVATGRPAATGGTGSPLLEAIQQGGTVDQLAARAGLTFVETLRLLGELEIAGLVQREPGQRYTTHSGFQGAGGGA